MKIFKKIFSLDYHPMLISNMAESTIPGAFASNLVVSSISASILYSFLPHTLIYIWLFIHLIILSLRIFISKKLRYFLKESYGEKKAKQYFIFSLILTSFAAIQYAVLIWFMYIYHVPDLYIFLITIIITLMAASSISILGSVVIAFILFVCLSVIPLILLVVSQDGKVFFILSFILLSYLILHILFGYRQYLMLKNTVLLEDTFKSIYNKSSDGIILIQNARIKDCNEAVLNMFQCNTKEELFSSKISNFMPELQEDGASSLRQMLKMLKVTLSNEKNSFEWIHKRKNGELFWTEVVLTKIYLDGKVLIHETVREIGDRKKLEIAKNSANKEIEALNQSLIQKIEEEVENNREKDKQLLKQSRMAQMGEMISMIAHQWRQPLAAISSTSASLELKASLNRLDNDTAQQKAQDISSFSQHLSKTIDDFRDFFKPNKKKIETTYDELIVSVLDIIGVSIENKNIKLIQELECHDSFTTYPNEIKQVILNLIKNAEDALLEKQTEDPSIRISTYKENDTYILEVSDNAGGISEEIIENIFDPYFSTKTKKDGTGLGLYMSKTIIEDHCGGEISVRNGYNGAVFKITHQ